MLHRPRFTSLLAVAAIVVAHMLGRSLVGVSAQESGPGYQVVDLGSLDTTRDDVADCAYLYGGGVGAVNDDGVITGSTPWTDRTGTAFRATDGKIKRLKGGKGGAEGAGINAEGQVVGSVTTARTGDPCDTAPTSSRRQAATWVGGELTMLPDDGADDSRAVAITDDGVIVGFTSTSSESADGFRSTYTPVLWRDGELEDLPLPSEADDVVGALAFAVNASAQIVGLVHNDEGTYIGSVLWDGGEVTLFLPDFFASDINDDGVVVGDSVVADSRQAGIVVDGEIEPLPGVPDTSETSSATGINAYGDVVGTIRVTDENGFHSNPVLWRGDDMTDLTTVLSDDVPFETFRPVDINADGLILGYGSSGDGNIGAVLVPQEP